MSIVCRSHLARSPISWSFLRSLIFKALVRAGDWSAWWSGELGDFGVRRLSHWDFGVLSGSSRISYPVWPKFYRDSLWSLVGEQWILGIYMRWLQRYTSLSWASSAHDSSLLGKLPLGPPPAILRYDSSRACPLHKLQCSSWFGRQTSWSPSSGRCFSIFKFEWHNFIAKKALLRDEQSVFLVRGVYFNLIVPWVCIHNVSSSCPVMASINWSILCSGKLSFGQALFKSVKSTHIRHFPLGFTRITFDNHYG